MIEELFNLVMALTSLAITLLDPMLQLANGVDLYMEAAHSSPLFVNCPPKVENGSWICSERRPLPECYLYCPSGLVPADESQVNCETYKQDNTTNFACTTAGVVIIGGLNEQDLPVTQVEVFSPGQRLQEPPYVELDDPPSGLAEQAENSAMISASTEWYDGKVVTCGGVYQKSCSSLESRNFGGGFEAHSVLKNLQEGASGDILGPRLQLRGSINNNTRSSTEGYTDQEGWTMGTRISQDAYQACTTRINATHAAISGGERNQGWLSILNAEGEVANVNLTGAGLHRWAHGCVAYQGRILITGGFTGRSSPFPTGSSLVLDLASMELRQVGAMTTPRAAFSRLVVMGEHAWAFGGLTGPGNGTTGTVERFHLGQETWEAASWSLSSPRAGHTVSSVPADDWKRSKDLTRDDNTSFIQPKFESPVVEGLDNYHAIVTMVLIYVPTIYICLSNLIKSLESGYTGMALRSLLTILIPFPFIQTLISFVTFKIMPEKYLEIIKPSTEKEKLDMEEMKAEIQMAGTFYNSCPSICLQILIIITFPNRVLSWIQIGSVSVSSFMTLWTAANLYQLKLEKASEGDLLVGKDVNATAEEVKSNETEGGRNTKFPSKMKTLLFTAALKVKSFMLAAPFILTSLVFNFSNIILGIINNNFFFVVYMLAAFISLFLPATFSPAESVKKLEQKMGLTEDTAITCCGVHLECGHSSNKKRGGEEKYEPFRPPPTSCRQFAKNMSWAFNVAYTNLFCITRPIGKDTPSVRHFMIGLYPLHFVVNMTTLVFERYFADTDVITIRGQIFSYNNVVLVAILTGLANMVLFILFYYPNFFFVVLRSAARKMYGGMTKTSALAATSMVKRRTYKVAETNRRIKEQVRQKLHQ